MTGEVESREARGVAAAPVRGTWTREGKLGAALAALAGALALGPWAKGVREHRPLFREPWTEDVIIHGHSGEGWILLLVFGMAVLAAATGTRAASAVGAGFAALGFLLGALALGNGGVTMWIDIQVFAEWKELTPGWGLLGAMAAGAAACVSLARDAALRDHPSA